MGQSAVDQDGIVALRPPHQVMRLARLGAFHQTRLSFLRAMMRQVATGDWTFECSQWDIDDAGVGVAVYAATGPDHTYSLICFAHDLDPDQRTDRVIAEAWDATFTLYDGVPDAAAIERLRGNTPRQEAGRYRHSDLILSRTNKSARLFDYVVDRLALGEQPDGARLDEAGYLMRTTAVYGNGKFGIADRDRYADRGGFGNPFRLEMLTVWLIRQFVADLTDHMARVKGGDRAVPLDRTLRRRLGVGNSTGLGLGPFIVNHPALFHRWIVARETALARVRALPAAEETRWQSFLDWLARAKADVADWNVADDLQAGKIGRLADDLETLSAEAPAMAAADHPWDSLYRWGEAHLSLEAQEMLVSLMIEPHGDLVDDLADEMGQNAADGPGIDGTRTAGDLKRSIETQHGWALTPDYDDPSACARFWYVSANKLEPRLGERHAEPGADLEQPLAVGRDLAALHQALSMADPETSVAAFLLSRPAHRQAARRVQIAARYPYAEIQDNLIGADLLPLDLLRCKLSFFGATQFDPKSDRWLRINMFRHAPYPDEIAAAAADDWAYPPVVPA